MKYPTSKVPGFDALPEETKNFLASLEVVDPVDYNKLATENKRLAEAAKARMTEDEQKEVARAEEFKALQAKVTSTEAELTQLRADKAKADHTAKFIGLGYDEKTAVEAAGHLVAGDMDKFFATQAKAMAEITAKTKSQQLSQTPAPGAGAGTVPIADFTKRFEEAVANGDLAGQAALIRLQQEASFAAAAGTSATPSAT